MWFSKPNAKVVKNLVLYNTYFVVYYYFALNNKWLYVPLVIFSRYKRHSDYCAENSMNIK